jgi:transposase
VDLGCPEGAGLEPVAAEQAVIARALRLRRRGLSYRAVAAKLNADGVPTKRGARWHHSTVRNVVRAARARGAS